MKDGYMPYELNEEGILINGIIDMGRSEDGMSHEILYLKNFGNSSAAIKNVYLDYSVERGVHPCKIGYWIEKEVVEPDEEVGFYIEYELLSEGKIEIERIAVDYIYEGEEYTSELKIISYSIEIRS